MRNGMMSEQRRREAAWAEWLRGMRWAFFGTGTFAQPLTPPAIRAVVEKWLARLPGAYAALGFQRGGEERYHVHLLIGGVRRAGLTEKLLRGSWVRNGHMEVRGYQPAKGGVEYLVRQAEEIELVGDPLPYRPR